MLYIGRSKDRQEDRNRNRGKCLFFERHYAHRGCATRRGERPLWSRVPRLCDSTPSHS